MSFEYKQVKAGEQTVFVAPMTITGGVVLSINMLNGSMSTTLTQEQMQELIKALESYVAVPTLPQPA